MINTINTGTVNWFWVILSVLTICPDDKFNTKMSTKEGQGKLLVLKDRKSKIIRISFYSKLFHVFSRILQNSISSFWYYKMAYHFGVQWSEWDILVQSEKCVTLLFVDKMSFKICNSHYIYLVILEIATWKFWGWIQMTLVIMSRDNLKSQEFIFI